MPKTKSPRKGSLQYWPRKRAKRVYAKVNARVNIKETKPVEFAGYKVGMTHLGIVDNRSTSLTKGQEIFCPATIIECPPLKIFSLKFYKSSKLLTEILAPNLDKDLARKLVIPKDVKKKVEHIDFDDIRLLVHTSPRTTSIGKKKPEVFEIALGGKKDEKLKWAKENLGKEINIKDVFNEGQQIDVHAVTKGKGLKGPVQRFGVGLKRHKSEKKKRTPGSLGPWCGQGKIMWKVAQAGQHGFHQRTEYNKWLLKIGNKPEEINTKGGFLHYGNIKNQYILVKGSVPGPAKRLLRLNTSIRQNKNIPNEAPAIKYISGVSK